MVYIPINLSRIIRERAGNRCEYCLIPESVSFAGFEVDHIIAQKHGGTTEENNLALSCSICNKHKGSDIASIDYETDKIVPLYNPRKNIWHEHFKIVDAHIIPITPTGRVTARLLQMNTMNRVQERKLLIMADLFNDLTIKNT